MKSTTLFQSPLANGELDLVFKALSDPIRRAIVERLSVSPANVSQLAEPFPVSQPAISRHLRVLEQADLIGREVKGRVHHCYVKPDALAGAAAWFEQNRQFWEQRLDSLAAFVEDET